jgi:RNA polymerase sigma-70 factor (ECF subfamily)
MASIDRFEEIYSLYWQKVYRLCRGYAGEDGKDLAQETFLAVYENLPRFRGEASIGTWIFRIAANLCLKHVKKPVYASLVGDYQEEVRSEDEQVVLLHRFIQELKEVDRLIISMELEALPQAEIARITGLSEGNVRVRVHRIKDILNQKFRQHGFE